MNNSPVSKFLLHFLTRGILEPVDLQVATTLLRLGGSEDPHLALAVALCVRAPSHGHICVDLATVAKELRQYPRQRRPLGAGRPLPLEADVPLLPWPEPKSWVETLRASPMVREEVEITADSGTPLVLEGSRVYLDRYARYQARLIADLQERAKDSGTDLGGPRLRESLDMLFVDDGNHPEGLDRQRLAACMAVLRRFTVISGGPGTGKTTTVKKILALLLMQHGASLRIALAAPTGKAAARLQESLRDGLEELPVNEEICCALGKIPTFTLHRLLGVRGDSRSRFRHHANNPLPYDVIVVDEASMVSFAHMAKLVDAVPKDARLILLGDRNQLASVDAGAVFGDLCSPRPGLQFSRSFVEKVQGVGGTDLSAQAKVVETAGIWDCMVELTRFYRFDARSGIGEVARAIQNMDKTTDSVFVCLEGKFSDLQWQHQDDFAARDHLRETVIEGYAPLVRAALQSNSPEEILAQLDRLRVLSPHRLGPMGVDVLNEKIALWLAEVVPGFDPGEGLWAPGQPVMITQNDRNLGLFNGDVGVVMADSRPRMAVFPSLDGPRLISVARIPHARPVFCMSIHKSQGSQFDHAVVALPERASQIMTRELIYTGITRGAKRVTVFGDRTVLERALKRRVRRQSGLRGALWNE